MKRVISNNRLSTLDNPRSQKNYQISSAERQTRESNGIIQKVGESNFSTPTTNISTIPVEDDSIDIIRTSLNVYKSYPRPFEDNSGDELVTDVSPSHYKMGKTLSRDKCPRLVKSDLKDTSSLKSQSISLIQPINQIDLNSFDQLMDELNTYGTPKSDTSNLGSSILKTKSIPTSPYYNSSTPIDYSVYMDIPGYHSSSSKKNEKKGKDNFSNLWRKRSDQILTKNQSLSKSDRSIESHFNNTKIYTQIKSNNQLLDKNFDYFKKPQILTDHIRIQLNDLEIFKVTDEFGLLEKSEHRNNISYISRISRGGHTAESINSNEQKQKIEDIDPFFHSKDIKHEAEEIISFHRRIRNLYATIGYKKKRQLGHSLDRHITPYIKSVENNPMCSNSIKDTHIKNAINEYMYCEKAQECPNPAVALNNWLEDFRARKRQHEKKEEILVAKARVEKTTLKIEAQKVLINSISSIGGTGIGENDCSNFSYFKRFYRSIILFNLSCRKRFSNLGTRTNIILRVQSFIQNILLSPTFSKENDIEVDCNNKRRYPYLCIFMSITIFSLSIGYFSQLFSPHSFFGNPKNMLSRNNIPLVGRVVSFFLLSNTPYTQYDLIMFRKQISSLGKINGSFLVHLGDIGIAYHKQCEEYVYQISASLLSNSPLPVFIIPGNNDWNECPHPRSAWKTWRKVFQSFDLNFSPFHFNVVRQNGRDENFSFLYNGVLFIGIHLVDGYVQNKQEWSMRHLQNVEWTEENLHKYIRDEYRAVVLLGHSPPRSKVVDYFWPIVDDWKKLQSTRRQNLPFLYIHANKYEMNLKEYKPSIFNVENMRAVEVPPGGGWNGLSRITVNFGPKPFKFEFF